jgi:hypothetical protein
MNASILCKMIYMQYLGMLGFAAISKRILTVAKAALAFYPKRSNEPDAHTLLTRWRTAKGWSNPFILANLGSDV